MSLQYQWLTTAVYIAILAVEYPVRRIPEKDLEEILIRY